MNNNQRAEAIRALTTEIGRIRQRLSITAPTDTEDTKAALRRKLSDAEYAKADLLEG